MNASYRIERLILTGLGLVLLAAGIYTLLRGIGTLGNAKSGSPVISSSTRGFLGNHEGWWWLAGAVSATVATMLGLALLRRQLSAVTHPGATQLVRRSDNGATFVSGGALAGALEDELQALPDIDHANADLTRAGSRPNVDMQLQVADDADLAAIRSSIENHVLERFRQAVEADELTARIRLKLARRNGHRVV